MSSQRDRSLLADIADAAERIIEFTQGLDAREFENDSRTHLAVQHQIMVIGEAAKRLSQDFRDEVPSIPWSGIMRMRDRLIHGYDTVDLEIVLDTSRRDVPQLLRIARERLDASDK